MDTCDKCGTTVKALWRAYSKKTFKYLELCNHHYNKYFEPLTEQQFIIYRIEEEN